MSWPSTVDYLAAVAHPAHCFADAQLAAARPAVGLDGAPLSFTGNSGCILKLEGQDGASWAVKCFTRPAASVPQRYAALTEHLGQQGRPFLVAFEYLTEGIRVAARWLPVVKMEWIEGEHLNAFVRRHAAQPRTLRKLAHVWLRLSHDLRLAGIGHGDLQHGNVLLTAGVRSGTVAVRLVDYDGLWVPALSSTPSEERGHPCYQHPRRGPEDGAGPDVDRFSHLVIYTALLALAAGRGPDLWQRYDTGDNLLFRAEDFADPARSSLLRTLWDLGGDVQALVGHLVLAAQGPCAATSLLHEVAAGETVVPPGTKEMERVRRLVGAEGATQRMAGAPLPGREILTLEVVDGAREGQQFTLTGHETFVVGRSKKAHLRLPDRDRSASRFHFLIELSSPHCVLVDLGSRNGTYVNDQRVQRTPLKSGDKVRVGKTCLCVHLSELPATVVTPEGETVEEELAAPPLALTLPAPLLGERRCRRCSAFLPSNTPFGLCADCRQALAGQKPGVPGYRLERELGRGGMGAVYLGVRDSDARVFAIKTIVPKVQASMRAVARFLREASLLRQLDHPHIVACRDLGYGEEVLYFAMDFIAGTDAGMLLHRDGPLPVRRAVHLLRQALSGLEYAHGRGLVHRDVKPSNLLIGQLQGQEHLWIADFGLARLYQASHLSGLTFTGDMGGTIAFMPAEQILSFRTASPASDQYAAAASLYQVLTGCTVYDFKDLPAEQVAQILNDDPVPILQRRADLPEGLAAVIHRALAREPEERWPDVAAFRQALEPFEQ